jgi:TRAP-type C4-dicarboxylate transport system permease small subunit
MMSASNSGGPARGGGGFGIAGRAHDMLTAVSFQLAIACLGIISVVYCYEVVLRYAFNAPTTWANPLVSYLLCALIFLAIPEMTRTSSHISINLLNDALPPSVSNALGQIVRLVGMIACLVGAWITSGETGSQFVGGIWTISYFPVPKWIVSIFIPYGFLSAGLYFLRQLLGDRAEAGARGGET